MKFYFHPDAKEEFDGAVEFYEQSQPGLGLEFAEEIYATIARIIQFSFHVLDFSQNEIQ